VNAPRLAQVEVHDADGRAARYVDVQRWPLTVGRALDNDLVLNDPHVAAHHARVDTGADGTLTLTVLDSRNGARIEQRRAPTLLRAGESAPLPPLARWRLGHSLLLVRRVQDMVADEMPLAAPPAASRSGMAALLLAGLGWLLASRWIDSDPDTRWLDHLLPLVSVLTGMLFWVLAWALASKLFTGRFVVAAHLRIAVGFGLAIEAAELLLPLLAFVADWPLASRLRSVVTIVIGAAWVAQHLAQLQPRRLGRIRVAVAAVTLLGLVATTALNWRRNDRLLDELYAPNLMPPSWRLAPAQPAAGFVLGLKALEEPLRERARKARSEDFEP